MVVVANADIADIAGASAVVVVDIHCCSWLLRDIERGFSSEHLVALAIVVTASLSLSLMANVFPIDLDIFLQTFPNNRP